MLSHIETDNMFPRLGVILRLGTILAFYGVNIFYSVMMSFVFSRMEHNQYDYCVSMGTLVAAKIPHAFLYSVNSGSVNMQDIKN